MPAHLDTVSGPGPSRGRVYFSTSNEVCFLKNNAVFRALCACQISSLMLHFRCDLHTLRTLSYNLPENHNKSTWGCVNVVLRQCEVERKWGWGNVRLSECEVKILSLSECEGVVMRLGECEVKSTCSSGCEAEIMWGWVNVRLKQCEGEVMRSWANEVKATR